jgi:BirA family biotin operon repressor/biotin-[acetyl-CoA-carboxylase] ligase
MIIGSKILFFRNLPSTNTHAAGLLKKEKLPEGTIVRAAFQSAGRGQMGNYWESEADKNLLISIILYPSNIDPADQFLISMTMSLGISDFLDRHISGCKIKWPNDIYVNNDKIAGILIENSVMDNRLLYSIAGIGLNINQKEFLSDAPNPVSLSLLTGCQYDPEVCLSQLSESIGKWYIKLKSGHRNEIRENYLSKLYRLNEWTIFHDEGGTFNGRILSAKDDGTLQIERDHGEIREYLFREVSFII